MLALTAALAKTAALLKLSRLNSIGFLFSDPLRRVFFLSVAENGFEQ